MANNIMFEILDGHGQNKRKASEPYAPRTNGCHCDYMRLDCPGGLKNVEACLPSCIGTKRDQQGICPGLYDHCDISEFLEASKAYAPSTRRFLNNLPHPGYCKSRKANTKFCGMKGMPVN